MIGMASGRAFDPLNPDANDMFIQDIANNLSRINRFIGATNRNWSVMHHSILVACLVPHEHIRQAIWHDAPEAYCGDMASPIKRHVPQFQAIENCIWAVMCEKFQINPALMPAVKLADKYACWIEHVALQNMPQHARLRDAWRPAAVQFQNIGFGFDPDLLYPIGKIAFYECLRNPEDFAHIIGLRIYEIFDQPRAELAKMVG